MPLPPDLPPQFSARLCAIVHALLDHRILKGQRQSVREPSEGDATLPFSAELDREAGTVHLVDFPPVTDRVATDLGTVEATVTVQGDPSGSYDPATGDVDIDITLLFDPKHMLARSSRVTLSLSTRTAIEQPELAVPGDPLTLTDGTLVLTGEGTFENGTLKGGTLWLSVACDVEAIEIEEAV